MTIKPAHKIFSLTHRNRWGKSNIWILLPLLQKNKYGHSQLYRGSKLLTYHLPLQQEIWLVFDSRSNLIGVTYISRWSTHWTTHWTAHNIRDAPTKRYFFYKKITQQDNLVVSTGLIVRWPIHIINTVDKTKSTATMTLPSGYTDETVSSLLFCSQKHFLNFLPQPFTWHWHGGALGCFCCSLLWLLSGWCGGLMVDGLDSSPGRHVTLPAPVVRGSG